MPVVELPYQDFVPGIPYRAGAAGKREQIGAPGNAAESAGLHRAGADLLEGDHAE